MLKSTRGAHAAAAASTVTATCAITYEPAAGGYDAYDAGPLEVTLRLRW